MADLDLGEGAVSTASGMGAIASVLGTFLSAGDELIADRTLYGCTYSLMREGLARFGVRVTSVDMTVPENLERAIGPKTKIVYFETPTNPNMRLVDIAAISRIAKSAGARVVVDNTYATPYLTQPLKLGASIVLHSATKYLGGHGDLVGGLAIGSAEDMARVRKIGLKDMTGAVMSPFNAHLILRGVKTLALRMDRHCRTAYAVATLLQSEQSVRVVHYPGLASFPQYQLAERQMLHPGGMIAFEMNRDRAGGIAMMDQLKVIRRAVSLGDAESLIQHPASMTHSTHSAEELRNHGIDEGLVRLSVGLEDEDDICRDLMLALRDAY